MKQLIFLLSIIILQLTANASTIEANKENHVELINGVEFTFTYTFLNDTVQRELVSIYRNDIKLLSHVLYDSDGDCSSENIQLGGFEIIENELIFYTYWASGDRMGNNIFPFGFQKQTYTVDLNGKLLIKHTETYVETYTNSWSVHDGMQFLNEAPTNEKEELLLKEYIEQVATAYDGVFVFGENKKMLENEVRTKLKSLIHYNTRNWGKIYKQNCNK